MIQLRTFLLGTDKTAIAKVYCIKVLKTANKSVASLGDVILVCINSVDIKKHSKLKGRFQRSFVVGTIHRALIVRTKVNYMRIHDIFLKFNENSMVIVSSKVVPLSNKVYGPLLREFCIRWPSLGCVATCII